MIHFQLTWAKPIFSRLKSSVGFLKIKTLALRCLIGTDRICGCVLDEAAQASHAWCLSACVCARVGCQSSGPGSPGISLPSDGIWPIPGTWIYPPAAEVWHDFFRLLFLVSMEAVVQLRLLPFSFFFFFLPDDLT